MVDEIVKAQGRLRQVMEREPDKNVSDYQTRTFQSAKVRMCIFHLHYCSIYCR